MKWVASTLATVFALGLLLSSSSPLAASEDAPNRIKPEYLPPERSEQQPVYELLKSRHTLERVQEIFSPFRIPVDLRVETKTCGMVNAYYQRKARNASLTICYELIDHILKRAPEAVTPAGVAPADAVVGHFFYVVAHEMGHAMFDLLEIPVFGRQEDAADQFSAYIMLQFGRADARRLITGAAYSYKEFVDKPSLTIPMKTFSDAHGAFAQRFYNLLCMAYGADQKLFADVVSKGFLPQERAQACPWEYQLIAYAFRQLIRPHLDEQLAKQVLKSDWLPEHIGPPRPQ